MHIELLNNKWVAFCVALIVVVQIYFCTYTFEYVLDDKIVFTENSLVQKGWAGIPKILTTESFAGYFGEQKDILPGARYRPLSLVTFAVESAIFGQQSGISHLINVFLYFLCALVLYRCISLLLKDYIPDGHEILAKLSAFLFLIHPVHVEAVANVKGRDEILVLIFSLLALIYAIKSMGSNHLKYVLATVISFLLALLSKENALTFLAVIPLSVFLFCKLSVKRIGTIGIALAVPTVIYFAMRYQAIGYILGNADPKDIMNNPFLYMGNSEKFATIAHTLLVYLKLLVFPHPLTHDYYPYHIPIKNWGDITPILSSVIHIGLALCAIISYKKRPIFSWSVLTYLFTMSIVSNVFVGVGTFMNERFLFVSSISIVVLMSSVFWTISQSASNVKKYIGATFLMVFVIGFIYKSMVRVPDWKNGMMLNYSAVKVSKNSARANLFMGINYFNQYKSSQSRSDKLNHLALADQYISKSFDLIPQYKNASKMKVAVAAENFKYDNDLQKLLSIFNRVANHAPETGFLHEYFRYLNDIPSYSSQLVEFYYKLGYENFFVAQKRNEWAARFLLYGAKVDENNQKINLALSKVYQALDRPNETQYYFQKAQNGSSEQ